MNEELLLLSREVGELLISKEHSIAIAESSSGGLISAHLLAIGPWDFMDRSVGFYGSAYRIPWIGL